MRPKLVTSGVNRQVLLTRRYAFKFPSFRSWRSVLYGILNNLNESENSTKLGACPVLWRGPLGVFLIMPRADEITDEEFSQINVDEFCLIYNLTVEAKKDSFGRLSGHLVAVDYGFPRELHW